MADQLSLLPASIIAGESISVTIPSSTVTGYTLAYHFSAPTPITVNCVANVTTAWTLSVTSAQTILWKRGNIRFAAMLTHTQTSVTSCVDSGVISIASSPLSVSQYAAYLTAIDAAILSFSGNANKRLSLGAMSVEYRSLDELLALRSTIQSWIAAETGNTTAGGGGAFRILSRF